MGHEVDVFTRRDDAKLPQVVNWLDGVRVIHVDAGPPEFVRKEDLLAFMPAFTGRMAAFCRRHGRYDLVHANFWMSGLVAAEIKKLMGIPFVVTFHALGRVRRQFQKEADEFPDERFEIEDRVIAAADAVVAECPQDKQDLIELYDAEPAKLRIIPCGFDAEELWPIAKAEARRHLRIGGMDPLVLQLGRMVPRKGVETVVRGFGKLLWEHKVRARLLVVGGESEDPDPAATPEIARLQSIAAEEGVANAVTFTGRRSREELRYYYSAADVFVTTPWYEPFGITPLEAMACGTPVVGSAVGGVKYTVRHGETGYLVPPRDPDALAARLARLLCDEETLTLLAENALRRVNEQFTWQRVAWLVAGLYEDVLRPKTPKTAREELLHVQSAMDTTMQKLDLPWAA